MRQTLKYVAQPRIREHRLYVVELVEFAEALGVEPLDLLSEFLTKRGKEVSPKTKRAIKQDA